MNDILYHSFESTFTGSAPAIICIKSLFENYTFRIIATGLEWLPEATDLNCDSLEYTIRRSSFPHISFDIHTVTLDPQGPLTFVHDLISGPHLIN